MTIGSGAGAPDADDLEKLQAIREVMDYAARVTIQTALAKPMRSLRIRPIALGLLALMALGVATFTFVSEPDWVFGPSADAAEPARHEAHLRYAMYLAAQRIESLRDSAGVPPASLAEIGEDWSGLEYTVRDLGVFELRGRTPSGDEITYKSGENLAALLGQARSSLKEAKR